jgi:lysophospholipase L1-like esterase
MSDVYRPKHRIVVIQDSMGMTRPAEGDQPRVTYEETWAKRFEHRVCQSFDAEVITYGQREKTSRALASDVDQYVALNQPDIVVLQVGLVDAVPRIISWRERQVLRLVPKGTREKFVDLRKDQRQARMMDGNPLAKVYVPPDSFRRNLQNFLDESNRQNGQCKYIMIPIIANTEKMEKKSPGYTQNLALYNQIVRDVFGGDVVDVPRLPESAYRPDGYHFNSEANGIVAKAVYDALTSRRWLS